MIKPQKETIFLGALLVVLFLFYGYDFYKEKKIDTSGVTTTGTVTYRKCYAATYHTSSSCTFVVRFKEALQHTIRQRISYEGGFEVPPYYVNDIVQIRYLPDSPKSILLLGYSAALSRIKLLVAQIIIYGTFLMIVYYLKERFSNF